MRDDAPAFEYIGPPSAEGFLVVSCEHASNEVPPPLTASAGDRQWLATHWGWDIGAAVVARYLTDHTGSAGILSTFSRLVCDPNRRPEQGSWIPSAVEGHELSFNRNLTDAERRRRLDTYHEPYHQALDRLLGERLARGGDVLFLSVHSFTPNYLDEVRHMDVGVLFDNFEPVARRLAEQLELQDFRTTLNEPYSGMQGMMSAAHRHGNAHGVIYLEIELRQDLLDTEEKALAVAARFCRAVESIKVRSKRRDD